MPGDRALILGKWVDLKLRAVGHYALNIMPSSQEEAELCLMTLHTNVKEKKDVRMGLLKRVNYNDKESRKLVVNIQEHCATCKKFSPTPERPVVSLPAVSKFGKILTADLKERKDGSADGMYLDRVEWKKDEVNLWEELDMEEVQMAMILAKEGQVIMIPAKKHGSPECKAIKKKEMDTFKEFYVNREVEDKGQKQISLRWVLRDK